MVKVARDAAATWGVSPSSHRAGMMFRLRELLDARRDDLAAIVTREHGKVLDDARGEVARGLECVEFACGIPHLLKGAHSAEVSRGIDVHTVLQPVGVVAGHHAVQLPGDGAAVDAGERAGVRQRLRVEALREGPVRVPAPRRAGAAGRLPRRRLQRRAGRRRSGRRAADPSRRRRGLVRRQHRGRPARLRDRHRARQARAGARRRQEPHGRAARRRRRRRRRRRHLRGLRVGRRALHGDLGRGRGRAGRRPARSTPSRPGSPTSSSGPATSPAR